MTSSRITDLLSRHPLVDGHNDLLWELRELANYDLDAVDLTRPVADTQTDLPRLRAGGGGGPVLVGVGALRPAAGAGGHGDSGADRRGTCADCAAQYRAWLRADRRRAGKGVCERPDRVGFRCRRRPFDRELAGDAAHALHVGCAIYDAHPREEHGLGGRVHRRTRIRRTDRFRGRSGTGNEPDGYVWSISRTWLPPQWTMRWMPPSRR